MAMAATKLLANTLKNILSDPVEGFSVELVDESNIFEWRVYIEGPKDTLYDGGVFQMNMKFPPDFPMSPPELRFVSDFWHPNVYRDTGLVCISILHPPGEDEMSGESAAERWLPTQTVTTILLSVISLLNAPNFSSPANVDAGVEWRNDPSGYKKKCQRLLEKANREKPEHVVIPHPDTNKEEREKQIEKMKAMNKPIEMDDFMNEVPELPEEEEETGSVISQQEESTEGSSEYKEGKEERKKPSSNSKRNEKSDAKGTEEKKNSQEKGTKKEKGSSSTANSSIKKGKKKKTGKEETEGETHLDVEFRTRKKKKCIIM